MSAIHAIFYGDPDGYPPIINSARLLAASGLGVHITGRGRRLRKSDYGPNVRVQMLHAQGKSSAVEFAHFLRRVLQQDHSSARLFVGHDMHGLLAARLLATRYNKPLMYHCHDFRPADATIPWGSRVVSAFERRWARTSNLVIVPDAERAELVRRELSLPEPPLVVANAPLLRPVASGEALGRALQERGRRYEKIVLRQGSVGPLHAIEETLRSLPLWSNKAWGFVVMGPGQASYIDELQALARALEVEERFVVLPPVSYDEVLLYTPGASLGHALYPPVHINHTNIATASNKIMEYMASGVPLLTSARPGLRRLVQTYNCGLTADESSPESIAAAVNTLLGDEEAARRQGEAGRKAFEEVFCYEKQFAPALQEIQRLARLSS